MSAFLGVVIVTRNHGATIGPVLRALVAQTEPADRVVVVDCGSEETGWAEEWQARPGFEVVLLGRNAGFTGGNNEGYRRLVAWHASGAQLGAAVRCAPETGAVLFLNPDVLVPERLFAQLRRLLVEERSADFGALTVRLMGWDFLAGRATGKVDSTGLFPVWSGWRDRRDGSPPMADRLEEIPALCGAFFLLRLAALTGVALHDGSIWDERYVAYKEDIELSLRFRRGGWRLAIWHGAEAWHGRGWNPDRRKMPRAVRVLSAKNELRLHATYRRWRVPLSLLKWIAVCWLDR